MLLRNFLKQEPHPVRFKGYEPGSEDARTVRVNDAKSRWRDAELSLKGCVRVEAIDPDGAILRTWEDPEYSAPEAAAGRALATATDDWRGNMAEMARIITESNREAVAMHFESSRMGWEALITIVRFQGERMQALERAWFKQVMSAEPPAEGEAMSPQMQALLALAGPALAALTSGGAQQTPPQKPPQPKPKSTNGAQ
jgi:hypothetical protein